MNCGDIAERLWEGFRRWKPCGVIALVAGLLAGACTSVSPRARGTDPVGEVSGEARFNARAGHGEALYLTLRGEQGESWRFLVDTGAPDTMLDRSLESKLGPALGSEAANYGWFGRRNVKVFAAPPLFLGRTRLRAGDRVLTDDFRALFPQRHIMGILGMDCLRHYCVQMDFGTATIRFLDQPPGGNLGKAFRLGTSAGGIFIEGDLLGAGPADFQVDTGCTVDAVMESGLFQAVVRRQTPIRTTRFRSPAGRPVLESLFAEGTFGGESYRRLIVDGADDNLLGLRFLARHVVTLDGPRSTLYLRRR